MTQSLDISEAHRRFFHDFGPSLQSDITGTSIMGLKFPKFKGNTESIPTLERFERDALTEYDFSLMRKIAISMDLNTPLLIEGGSGIGKSQAVERVCALAGRPMFYANCHDFSADVLIGSAGVVEGTQTGFGWIDGIVVQAIRNGGVLFLDEYNFMLGETRGRLHEILDAILRGKGEVILVENNGERVEVHPEFRIVAAQNPPGEGFTDRYFLDAAQMTRFQYTKEPSSLPEQIKLARTLQSLGVSPTTTPDTSLHLDVSRSLTREQLLGRPDMIDFMEKFTRFHDIIEQHIYDRTVAADQSQPLYLSFQRELNRVLEFTARYWDGSLASSAKKALTFVYENNFESINDKSTIRNLIELSFSEIKIIDPATISDCKRGGGSIDRHIQVKGNTVEVCGVPLPLGVGGERVPKSSRFRKNILTAFDRARMQKIALALRLNQPVLIEGGTGLGKSEISEWLCSVTNQECYYANCQDFTADVLIGAQTTKEGTTSGFGWVDGIVTAAVRNGGVLFLDEYNFMNGETRGRLHEILDAIIRGKSSIVLTENGGEVVPVHPNFRIIAAQNPPGDMFLDRMVLDPAQLTRFVYIKEASQMPSKYKRARALALVGLEVENGIPVVDQIYPGREKLSMDEFRKIPGAADLLGNKFVEFHRAISSVVSNGGLGDMQSQPVSFAFQRDFDRLVNYITNCFDGDLNSTMQTGLKLYFMNRFDTPADRAKVREMMTHVKLSPKADIRRIVPTIVKSRGIDALEMEAIPFLDNLIKLGLDQESLMYAISGLCSEQAHKWRRESPAVVAVSAMYSLAGVDNEESLALREELLARITDSNLKNQALDLSLHGVDSTEIQKLRKRYNCDMTIDSIAGMTGQVPNKIRDEVLKSINSQGIRSQMTIAKLLAHDSSDLFKSLLESYTGIASVFADEIRSRGKGITSRRGQVLRSLAFMDSINAEEERILIGGFGNETLKVDMLIGLAGVDTPMAWRFRESSMSDLLLHEAVAKSLAGIATKRAWDMRKRLASANSPKALEYAALSITGGPLLAGVRRSILDRQAADIKIVKFISN